MSKLESYLERQRLAKCGFGGGYQNTNWIDPTEVKFHVFYEVYRSRKFIKDPERTVMFISHLHRHNEFVTNNIEGKVHATREQASSKKPYLEDIIQ